MMESSILAPRQANDMNTVIFGFNNEIFALIADGWIIHVFASVHILTSYIYLNDAKKKW
jgi:hypothetical protein